MRVSQSVGNTPLIKLSDAVYAKLESVNPSGSIKDRMAKFLLDAAEARGEIKPGDMIIEATSGNTGIAFAMLAAERGYRMVVVMPSNMSTERKQLIRSFGAEIVEVGAGDFLGAVAKRDELLAKNRGFNPNQFANPENAECHYRTTGQEILRQLAASGENRPVSVFVAGVGTGGTLMGAGRAMKERFTEVDIVGVEPTESAVMSGGKGGIHGIQGIGDGFIPDLVDMDFIDEIITVSTADAIARTKQLMTKCGLLVGISSGANVVAAEKYLEKHSAAGVAVTVLCDRGERYLSMIDL